MKPDAAIGFGRIRGNKRPSKETLNHAGLIRLASGMDPWTETKEAFLAAYEALGIDIINRVPLEKAHRPLTEGSIEDLGNGYRKMPLGLYDTVCRHAFPFKDTEEFWRAPTISLDYASLVTPVPHPLDAWDIRRREEALGDRGCYYCQFYTTLFMWGVEYLGWDVYMVAAMEDPEGFREKFLDVAFRASMAGIRVLCETDCPFVFLHDDLADARGPIFPPRWYEAYILPRYPELFAPVHRTGKKLIFVADGNMEHFLGPLKALGVDGVMLESPATGMKKIMENFGDRIIIGGIDTRCLTFGKPAEIRRHVAETASMTQDLGAFALSSCGGLHGNIPMENLEAYFDARVDAGFTLSGWRAST